MPLPPRARVDSTVPVRVRILTTARRRRSLLLRRTLRRRVRRGCTDRATPTRKGRRRRRTEAVVCAAPSRSPPRLRGWRQPLLRRRRALPPPLSWLLQLLRWQLRPLRVAQRGVLLLLPRPCCALRRRPPAGREPTPPQGTVSGGVRLASTCARRWHRHPLSALREDRPRIRHQR